MTYDGRIATRAELERDLDEAHRTIRAQQEYINRLEGSMDSEDLPEVPCLKRWGDEG